MRRVEETADFHVVMRAAIVVIDVGADVDRRAIAEEREGTRRI